MKFEEITCYNLVTRCLSKEFEYYTVKRSSDIIFRRNEGEDKDRHCFDVLIVRII